MAGKTIRKQTHELVDQLDEPFLKIVYQLMLSRQVSTQPVHFSPSEQAMLLKRREELVSGKVKGVTFKESIRRAKSNLRKKGK